MKNRPVVQLVNVSKRIGDKTIVDRVSMDVYPGEIFGLLGPNGAGKTTIIRMMTGLISATEGEIIINGHNVATRFEQAISHVGAIVENPQFYPFLTGYQNLLHFARMFPGIGPERMEEVLEMVGLSGREHDPVATWSLGMRQRLGVAQAVLHRPSVLILDEPTNGLDPAGIRELRDYLRHLAETENTAVIVSSHLLSEMELMCDRVAIIQRGRLVNIQPVSAVQGEEREIPVFFETGKLPPKLPKQLKDRKITLHDNGFEALLLRNQIPQVVKRLTEAGIPIYGITRHVKRLEDRYLEVTGGESND
ncbi:ABC transporter ATP-binding protein [Staphylospora marina]|uniref:ABC transporter ATP-binding protein n=1 Tax=Staphylospora marina TaxID=2490858 RepID=UPI001F14C726|nr:ABC transporter ATP-binding protein [Staphylospora marina]